MKLKDKTLQSHAGKACLKKHGRKHFSEMGKMSGLARRNKKKKL